MNKYLSIGIIVVLATVGGWWYFNRITPSVVSKTEYKMEQKKDTATNIQPSQSDNQTDITANWKTFVNSRDGYKVKYPSEKIAGTPTIDCCADLTKYGFNQSMSFIRYGGWADIYIFSGSIDSALTAYKKIDSEHRVYGPFEDINIDGKQGKIASWTLNTSSSTQVYHSYFVEYMPSKTLYIGGSEEFASTIQFI